MSTRFLLLPLLTLLWSPHAADGASVELLRASGPRAHFVHDRDDNLRLGTHLDLAVDGDSPESIVDEFLERFPDDFPTPEGMSAQTIAWHLGSLQVVRRTWTWQDMPVEHLSLTLHQDARGHIVVFSTEGLSLGAGRPANPVIQERDAQARAWSWAENVPGFVPIHAIAAIGPEVSREGLRLVWQVRLEGETPGIPIDVRLDAASGEFLSILPAAVDFSTTSREARGKVFADSYLDGVTVDAVLPDLDDSEYLTGAYADVWQFDPPGSYAQTAIPTSNSGDRYDYPPTEEYTSSGPSTATQTDAFAEVMMYYHLNQIHQYFNARGYYNDDPLTGIDRSMGAIVNYRSAMGYYDNAYYSPASIASSGQIVFGQGEATDFSYDSSVIYHEYGHAVVDGSSKYLFYCANDIYGSDCTQGGLNEGSADYFSASFRGDPDVGDYAMGEWISMYARDLTMSNRCPDDLYGEEHEDGKIWGGALWDVRKALAPNDELAHALVDPLILATVVTPVPSNTSSGSAFSYAADILLSDAEAEFGAGSSTVKTIESALETRGLVDCMRFVPLASGEVKEGAFSTAARPSRQSVTAAGLQYEVDVPDSATTFEFVVTGITKMTLYLRKDQPVEFSSDGRVTASDYESAASSFELDESSSPALDPGHTYYVTFTSTQTFQSALYGYYYTVQATYAKPFESAETAGCGCSHSSESGRKEVLSLFCAVLMGIGVRRESARRR